MGLRTWLLFFPALHVVKRRLNIAWYRGIRSALFLYLLMTILLQMCTKKSTQPIKELLVLAGHGWQKPLQRKIDGCIRLIWPLERMKEYWKKRCVTDWGVHELSTLRCFLIFMIWKWLSTHIHFFSCFVIISHTFILCNTVHAEQRNFLSF